MLCVGNYHYIRTGFKAKYPSIFGFTPSQFKMQLENLSKYGEFISQPELLQKIEQPLQKNYILITFDDGLKEQYEIAKPILDEMGIPFIFFSCSGGQRMMVAITMVVIKDTRIILLDEATAAFDPMTEKIFQNAIETLKSSKTVIMIA